MRERSITVCLPLKHPLLGTWPTIQECALTGNPTGDPLVHRLVLKPLSHTSQSPTLFLSDSPGNTYSILLSPVSAAMRQSTLK